MLSIESQRDELRRFAERERLSIVAVIEEARSAKYPGRPLFNGLMKRVERGEADGILAWHPDRLARNSIDSGMIIHFLDIGKLTSLKFPTYTFENSAQGKFVLAIAFDQSKYYVDSLSENVRRGNRAKRARGWLPGRAPIGYINSRTELGDKIILPDPVRYGVLRQLWEMLLTGGFSVPQLLTIATDQFGLRTPKRRRVGGSPVSTSGLYRVFSNPFYAGQILYQSQWYPGRHESMISIAQFERAQALLGKSTAARPKEHVFAYTGLMRCGSCGGSITAERKVNRFGTRYVYYHCTHKRAHTQCRERCVEERNLEEQICAFLMSISLDREGLERLQAILEVERSKERNDDDSIKLAIEQAIEKSLRNSDNLTKLHYRELIGEEEFVRQRGELLQEQAKLNQRLKQLSSEEWIEPSQRLFLFSNRAVFWAVHGTEDQKRLILATVGSNPTIMDRKLNIDARKPFRRLAEKHSTSDWQPIVNDVRTFFLEHPEVVIPLLPDPDAERTLAA